MPYTSTSRKQRARRASTSSPATAAELAATIDAMPDAVLLTDLDGTVLHANAAFHALYATATRPDFLSLGAEERARLLRLRDQDGRPLLPEHLPFRTFQQAQVGTPLEPVVGRARALDGRELWLSITGGPVRDGEGRVVSSVVTIRDITERTQAEAAGAWLAAIVSSSHDAIASKTLDGTITSWNESAERMFGYTPEEIIGQSVRRLIPCDRQEEEDRILARLRAGERIEHFETVRVRKDGSHLDVSLTISPIRDRAGTIVGASKIARDITERKRLERERAELVGIVAHDLGNPLAALKARLQMLQRQVARGMAPEASALDSLAETVARMDRLVQDLRDAEAIEGGQLTLQRDRCDLAHLCRTEVAAARAASGRRIELELPEGAVEVEADRDRIGQVVANLLSNALKYSPSDRPVTLTLERVEPDGTEAAPPNAPPQPASVRVSVRDEGPGIPPEALPQLFERFYRVPGIEARPGERRGLGLGLYICRQLIEGHGGQIGVESTLGHGSAFSFTLPLIR